MSNPTPTKDPFSPLKFRGYCWAFTPPGNDFTLEDFVLFCKFYLCNKTATLWKDPIWDRYTDEELMTEYFAYLFSNDPDKKSEFEASRNLGSDLYGEDIYEWLDRKIAENQREMEEQLESLPDNISFSPTSTEASE